MMCASSKSSEGSDGLGSEGDLIDVDALGDDSPPNVVLLDEELGTILSDSEWTTFSWVINVRSQFVCVVRCHSVVEFFYWFLRASNHSTDWTVISQFCSRCIWKVKKLCYYSEMLFSISFEVFDPNTSLNWFHPGLMFFRFQNAHV